MLFQPDTKNFPEGDKEWKLPHMAGPQQSEIFKASSPQHYSSPSKSGPGKKNLQSKKSVKSEMEVKEDSNFTQTQKQ